MKYNLQQSVVCECECAHVRSYRTSIKCKKYQNHILHCKFRTCFNFCFVAIAPLELERSTHFRYTSITLQFKSTKSYRLTFSSDFSDAFDFAQQ